MFPCEIQSSMKAPCQRRHTIPIQSGVIRSRTVLRYIDVGQGMLAMKAGFHYQILDCIQSLTSLTLDPITCDSNHISIFTSITLQHLLDRCFEFTVRIWWLHLYWSHQLRPQTVLVYLKTQWRLSCPDRDSPLEVVKMETELYPYNPIRRWLSPQMIMASLDVSVHSLSYRGAPVFKRYFNQVWTSFSRSCADQHYGGGHLPRGIKSLDGT